MKRILITGSNGFIGSNLKSCLSVNENYKVDGFDIANTDDELKEFIQHADFIIHLAGVNRPENLEEFTVGNVVLTGKILTMLKNMGYNTPVLMTSSIQSDLDNPYGKSKKAAEELLLNYREQGGISYIYIDYQIFLGNGAGQIIILLSQHSVIILHQELILQFQTEHIK